MEDKRGDNILVQNIIFITLIVIFIAMLLLFVGRSASGESQIEEWYSKKIALMIEAGKPGMKIEFNAEDLFDVAEENNWDKRSVVLINDTNVFVKTHSKGGYNYGFFNDVDVSVNIDGDKLILEIQ